MGRWLRRAMAAFLTLALLAAPVGALSPEQARELLETFYIDPLPAAAYRAETMDELIEALGDPYTYYMDAARYAAFTQSVEHESAVTGIGASVRYSERGIELAAVYDGGGAQAAGLRAGEVIVGIDGVACVPGEPDHRERLLGEPGTVVTLAVQGEDGAVRTVRVVRETVVIRNTNAAVDGQVGWIDCASFGTQTAEYFRRAVTQYDAAVHGWIVDLRGNPGGLTQSAADALGVFSGPGTYAYFLDRTRESVPVRSFEPRRTERPVIVLMDGESASAAELFAGGIRAGDAGILIGARSYGKGTAQIVLDREFAVGLFEGDALRLTAYRFFCGDGNTPDVFGVLPTLPMDPALGERAAKLLFTQGPEEGEYLRLTLCGRTFSVELAAAHDDAAALCALLGALPPQTVLEYGKDGKTTPCDARKAARLCGVPYTGRWFGDLSASGYAQEINALATQGILRGDDGARFRPDAALTRAELCAMLAQAMEVTTRIDDTFADVRSGDWFCPAVNAMAALGLVKGVGGGCFAPDAPLTQEQFITIMARFAALLNFRFCEYGRIVDEQGLDADLTPDSYADWARVGAAALCSYVRDAHGSYETMLADRLENLPARESVTREQAAATLYRVLSGLGMLRY